MTVSEHPPQAPGASQTLAAAFLTDMARATQCVALTAEHLPVASVPLRVGIAEPLLQRLLDIKARTSM